MAQSSGLVHNGARALFQGVAMTPPRALDARPFGLSLLVSGLAVAMAALAMAARFLSDIAADVVPPAPEGALWRELEYNAGPSAMLLIFGLLALDAARVAGGPRPHWAGAIQVVAAATGALAALTSTAGLLLDLDVIGRTAADTAMALTLIAMTLAGGAALGRARRLLEPPWIWWGAASLGALSLMAFTAAYGLEDAQVFWLLVAAYPAAMAVCTTTYGEAGRPSAAARIATAFGTVLGALCAGGLIAALLSDDRVLVLSFFYLLMMAALLNLVAIGAAMLGAARRTPDPGAWGLALGGVVLLISAMLPSWSPDWIPERRDWFQRAGMIPAQAFLGVFLVTIAGLIRLLRRHDPRGGPPRLAPWFLLVAAFAFLALDNLKGLLSSYDVFINHQMDRPAIILHGRIASASALLYLALLGALAPSWWRATLDLLKRSAPEPG